ncbi:hypothetical protein PG996_003273 [Apiospora saccharicola]|uniref:Uncharacterized protein n=1 Tax=Apiospora saccharicola TaxID=335842 RepID=A0ABR1W4N7_9PEZI
MYNLKLATLGLMATAALPAMAYLPPHKRSEAPVDLGTLESLEAFYQDLGLSAADVANWQAIEELETHDWDAIAAEDAARAAAGVSEKDVTSPAATPENMGLATRQSEDQCANLTGFANILCANMPSRAAWWTAGGAMAIWYAPEALVRWTDAVAHVIKTSRSLRQVKGAGELGARSVSSGTRQIKFSVPVFHGNGNSSSSVLATRNADQDADMTVHNDYLFEEAAGVLHYQGTRAALAADADERAPSSAVRGSVQSRQTRSYTIVIQATALTSASTLASESCIASVVKYHINRATEQDRFRCVPVDNRGSWKMALHVNVNKGRGNGGEYRTCCDF